MPCCRHDPMDIGQDVSVIINTGGTIGHQHIPLRINVDQNFDSVVQSWSTPFCKEQFLFRTHRIRYALSFFTEQEEQN
jgi:hypothetical protein